MAVVTDYENEPYYSGLKRGVCSMCGDRILHHPYLVGGGGGGGASCMMFICSACCQHSGNGLMADIVQVKAIMDIRKLTAPKHDYVLVRQRRGPPAPDFN